MSILNRVVYLATTCLLDNDGFFPLLLFTFGSATRIPRHNCTPTSGWAPAAMNASSALALIFWRLSPSFSTRVEITISIYELNYPFNWPSARASGNDEQILAMKFIDLWATPAILSWIVNLTAPTALTNASSEFSFITWFSIEPMASSLSYQVFEKSFPTSSSPKMSIKGCAFVRLSYEISSTCIYPTSFGSCPSGYSDI